MQQTPQRMLDVSTVTQARADVTDDKSPSGHVLLLGDAAGGIFPALGQ